MIFPFFFCFAKDHKNNPGQNLWPALHLQISGQKYRGVESIFETVPERHSDHHF
jgi:hypothetical protein